MASRLLWEFYYFGTKTPWEARGLSDKIRRAVIAEGVTSIGSASFQYCRALQQVQLPDSLQAIGDCAFQDTALTEICIPKNVEVIGDSAFADCANLVSVVIDSRSTMKIGAFAFGDTPFMQNAQYDRNGLLILNGHLLSARKDLEGVCTIPEGVTDIADYAFYDYYPEISESDSAKITKAVFPKSLQYIGSYAFQGCSNLREVRIKGEEVRFGYSPFSETAMPDEQIEAYTAAWPDEPVEAPAPTEILIGPGDKDIATHCYEKKKKENGSFEKIDRLKRYVVAPANPYYKAVDGVLYSKDGTILLRYPGGRTDDTFTVPQGVKVIGARAFQRYGGSSKAGLRKVVLPEGVTVIRERVRQLRESRRNRSAVDAENHRRMCLQRQYDADRHPAAGRSAGDRRVLPLRERSYACPYSFHRGKHPRWRVQPQCAADHRRLQPRAVQGRVRHGTRNTCRRGNRRSDHDRAGHTGYIRSRAE